MTNTYIAFARRDAARAGSFVPSAKVLDAIAEAKITGGFKTGRANQCPGCFTARSANGSCGC